MWSPVGGRGPSRPRRGQLFNFVTGARRSLRSPAVRIDGRVPFRPCANVSRPRGRRVRWRRRRVEASCRFFTGYRCETHTLVNDALKQRINFRCLYYYFILRIFCDYIELNLKQEVNDVKLCSSKQLGERHQTNVVYEEKAFDYSVLTVQKNTVKRQ